jgi:REP element-mobilizing transposase RayT
VRLDEYIIMPNHIHGILVLKEIRGHNMLCPYERADGAIPSTGGQEPYPAAGIGHNPDISGCSCGEPEFRQARAWDAVPMPGVPFGRAIEGNVATIVRSFKGAATKEVRHSSNDSDIVLWHRNYYEHIIRGESELLAARKYIAENPAKWEADEENI